MNDFSMLCRVLGSLFYRQPQDPLLEPLYQLISEGKLAQHWPLQQDDQLARLQNNCDAGLLAQDYNALFVGEACRVSPLRSAWVEGGSEQEVRDFLAGQGMPLGEGPAEHFGALLLAGSWFEDNAEPESRALETLFAVWLLPWSDNFLGKVEAHAVTPFWRTLAQLTREALQAMREELQEEGNAPEDE